MQCLCKNIMPSILNIKMVNSPNVKWICKFIDRWLEQEQVGQPHWQYDANVQFLRFSMEFPVHTRTKTLTLHGNDLDLGY